MSDVQQNVIGGTSQSSVQRGECSETPSSGASCTLDQIYTSNGQTREFGPATGTAEGNLHTCSGTTGEGGPTCTNSSLID